MKIERTRNATRNMVFGSILKIVQIILPFFMRTVMLYVLGMQYLGLNSLFTSVLQVLNLAELGIGSAMVFSMYKPVAEDDTKTLCALMRLYKIYYRIIGLAIAVVGVILVPFIPKLISGTVPSDMNIYYLYLLNLGATVISYWLFAYRNSILTAYQRVDIISKISLVTIIIQYVLQILVLVIFKSYYLYLIIALITQALTNIVTAIIVKRLYPQYKAEGKLDKEQVKEINCRIRDLFTSKLGAVIVNSVDTIVISAFLGLTVLGVYQNYFYILNAILGFITVIFTSCMAGVGNSIIVETKEKNFKDLEKFTFIIVWISGFCAVCLLCLYQPFMKIWVGEEYMLTFSAVICLCVYYFVYEINQLLNMYKDAAGIWHSDRFRPLVTALANLALNLILVNIIGIYGIILSTVLSTVFIGMPWLMYNLFSNLFKIEYLGFYLKRLCSYIIVTILACTITNFICTLVPYEGYIELIVKGVICCIIPNLMFFICYRKLSEFSSVIELLDKMTKNKFQFCKRMNIGAKNI